LKVIDSLEGRGKLFQKMIHVHSAMIPEKTKDPDCPICKAERAEESIPKKDFKYRSKTITEIKLYRGRYGDCIGWSFGSR